jgi:hypothetical protein
MTHQLGAVSSALVASVLVPAAATPRSAISKIIMQVRNMNLGMAAPVLPNWKWRPKEYRAAATPIEAVRPFKVFYLFVTVLCETRVIVCTAELFGVLFVCYLFVICLLFYICLLLLVIN